MVRQKVGDREISILRMVPIINKYTVTYVMTTCEGGRVL